MLPSVDEKWSFYILSDSPEDPLVREGRHSLMCDGRGGPCEDDVRREVCISIITAP